MYRSVVDALPNELAFDFDPLRPFHAPNRSTLKWAEYPYKQANIDKLCAKFTNPKLTIEAAAGALLIARGDHSRAVFEVDQHFDHDHVADPKNSSEQTITNNGWRVLEDRFQTERDAFQKAKREYLKAEKLKVATKLQGIAQRKKDDEDRIAEEAWKRRQIIKRYENGSKYDGEGVHDNDVAVPHGYGTLWVPQKESSSAGSSSIGDVKRVPQYVGQWMDGFMHGHGTYYWRNGDTWEGHFCRDELQGKGVFTVGNVDANGDIDTSRQDLPKEQHIRFYEASQHICWGEELVRGCRLRIFENRLFGDPLAMVVRRHNVDLEEETEFVIVEYDEKRDQYRVRKEETETTKWISLTNTNFRVVQSRPMARFEPGE